MARTMARTLNLKKLNDQNSDISSIYSNKAPLSSEDLYVTCQSCSDDSLLSNDLEIKRKNHYIKHSKLNRNNDYITSLKRRVRKQQLTHEETQVTNFRLPSSTNLRFVSYLQQSVKPCHHRPKKSSCVVPLPPLVTNSRAVRTRVHGIKRNMYDY